MGFEYGTSSARVMFTVHPVLQLQGLYLLEEIDHSAIEGFRNKDKQNWYYASGRTRPGPYMTGKQWPDGNHNGIGGREPSLAVHWRPYPWPREVEASRKEWKNLKRFYDLIGVARGIFKMLQIAKLIPSEFNHVSGGDWDDDHDLDDQKFNDLLHHELHGPADLILESTQWRVVPGVGDWPWVLHTDGREM